MEVRTSKKSYRSIGKCIYCESASGPLTDEHIIPYGLEGHLVFEGASCKSCEKKTGAVENQCLGDLLYAARRKLGMRSRKPKKQKKEVRTFVINSNGESIRHSIPVDVFPNALFMFSFDTPGILLNAAPNSEFKARQWYSLNQNQLEKYIAENNLRGVAFGKMQPFTFARMLAKIAHSYAVAEKGHHTFIPMLPRLILEGIDAPSYYVGGDLETPPRDADVLHWLRLSVIKGYLIAHIRLFAVLGAPVYHVVVGTWKGAEN